MKSCISRVAKVQNFQPLKRAANLATFLFNLALFKCSLKANKTVNAARNINVNGNNKSNKQEKKNDLLPHEREELSELAGVVLPRTIAKTTRTSRRRWGGSEDSDTGARQPRVVNDRALSESGEERGVVLADGAVPTDVACHKPWASGRQPRARPLAADRVGHDREVFCLDFVYPSPARYGTAARCGSAARCGALGRREPGHERHECRECERRERYAFFPRVSSLRAGFFCVLCRFAHLRRSCHGSFSARGGALFSWRAVCGFFPLWLFSAVAFFRCGFFPLWLFRHKPRTSSRRAIFALSIIHWPASQHVGFFLRRLVFCSTTRFLSLPFPL